MNEEKSSTFKFISDHRKFINQKSFAKMKEVIATTQEEMDIKELISDHEENLVLIEKDINKVLEILNRTKDSLFSEAKKERKQKALIERRKYPTDVMIEHLTLSVLSGLIIGIATGYIAAGFSAGLDLSMWSQNALIIGGVTTTIAGTPSTIFINQNFKKSFDTEKIKTKKFSLERLLYRNAMKRYDKQEQKAKDEITKIRLTRSNTHDLLEQMLNTNTNPFLEKALTSRKFKMISTKDKLSHQYDYLKRSDKKELLNALDDIVERKNRLIQIYDGLRKYKSVQVSEPVIEKTPRKQDEKSKQVILSNIQEQNPGKKILVVRKKKIESNSHSNSRR